MSEKLTEKVANLSFISFYYNSMTAFKLDELQKRLIAFFKQNLDQEGLTLREIANEVWASHPQTVLNKLNQLVLKGYFVKDDRWYRLIREEVWKRNDDIIQLPIYGFAQCGNKGKEIIDEYSQEKMPVTVAFVGTSDLEYGAKNPRWRPCFDPPTTKLWWVRLRFCRTQSAPKTQKNHQTRQ